MQKNVERATLEQKVKTARISLLVLTILTAVNIFFLLINLQYILPFSASAPYYAIFEGILTGSGIFLALCITIALICITLYVMCWLFGKDHFVWLYAAFAMMLLDTAFLLYLHFIANAFIINLDTVTHIFIVWCLFSGARSGQRLAKMPNEEEFVAIATETAPEDTTLPAEGPPEGESEPPAPVLGKPLRIAATDKIFREYLSAEHNGHCISYRRTGRVNELVIDGYVYDEVSMLFESTHNLTVTIDGHRYDAGFDGISHSYLKADGKFLDRKLRIY